MKYAILFSLLPALIHVGFFALESIFWGHPKVNRIFNLRTKEQVDHTRLLALNQGYYNLFLSIAVLGGIVVFFFYETLGLTADVGPSIGKVLVSYSLLSMIGAGVVLYFSAKNLRGFVLQAGPAALALILIVLEGATRYI